MDDQQTITWYGNQASWEVWMLLIVAANRGDWGPYTALDVLQLQGRINPGGYGQHVVHSKARGVDPKPPLTLARVRAALGRLVSIGLAIEAP